MRTPKQSEAAFACGFAMHACLAALVHQLAEAQQLAIDARNAMERREVDLAIGTVMPLEQVMPECETLLRAVRTLRRWGQRLPQTEVECAAEGGAK